MIGIKNTEFKRSLEGDMRFYGSLLPSLSKSISKHSMFRAYTSIARLIYTSCESEYLKFRI